MANTTTDETEGLPLQVKIMFLLIALVLAFVIGIDLLEFATAL
ncbi:hypothetical protein [Halorientalis marina]|jgi:hypothetical protein|nr:hypothetical protein [Halorientalis marina]